MADWINNAKAQSTTDFNLVKNWGLHVFEFFVIKDKGTNEVKGVMFRCSLSGKKKEDGTFPKSMPVSVFCYYDNCKIPDEDPTGKNISVSGRFTVGESVGKDGTIYASYSINATEIEVRNNG